MTIGAAGTHPFAMWEDQRIVARPRYRDLISALRFVARQELIFGVHVHVGVDDPDKAIHVANGMRVHMPVLLGLSANSPFWRADATGLASTRTPIFRAFPRVGIPPTYKDWEDYERRIEFMIDARVIEDYTYLWHDVRPHPNFGTVEIRVMDSQTHVEHTLGLAALVQGLVKELCEHFDAGKQLSRYPFEMLDENKWLAARHGLEGELVDLPSSDRVADAGAGPAAARPDPRPLPGPRLRRRARRGRGPARARQRRRAAGRRVRGQPRSARGDGRDRRRLRRSERSVSRADWALHATDVTALPRRCGRGGFTIDQTMSTGNPDLFVICKSCGSEVSPYITECPYCGNRLRKRAPKLDRDGRVTEKRRRRARPRRRCRACAAARSRGSGPSRGPTRRSRWSLAGLVGALLWRTGAVAARPDRDHREARIALVAADHGAVHLQQHRLRVRHARGDRGLRLAARAPPRPAAGAGAVRDRGRRRRRRHRGDLRRPRVLGANGAALALMIAWAIPDLLALRRGEEIDGDLLGTAVIAVVVALMPLVVHPGASWISDAVGVLGGVVVGLPLALTQALSADADRPGGPVDQPADHRAGHLRCAVRSDRDQQPARGHRVAHEPPPGLGDRRRRTS